MRRMIMNKKMKLIYGGYIMDDYIGVVIILIY